MKRRVDGDTAVRRLSVGRHDNDGDLSWIGRIDTVRGPRYLAIIACLEDAIRSGQLAPKMRLPPQRRLAELLGLTVGTTGRAYTIAAERGLITGETGRGTFVREQAFGGNDGGINPLLGALVGSTPKASGLQNVPTEMQVMDLALHSVPGDVSDILTRLTGELAARQFSAMPRKYVTRRAPLRYAAAASRWLQGIGLDVEPQRIVVTAGGFQAVAAAILGNMARGEPILTDSITYSGLKAVAFNYGWRLEPLLRDEGGMLPEALERAAVEGRGRIVYVQTELHNPTAVVMSLERRKAIVDIARRHDLLLIEDHAALSDLSSQIPPLAALAPEHTFLIASATKSVSVSVSAGYIVAPPGWGERFELQTRDRYFQISPLGAEIMTHIIETGAIRDIAQAYRAAIRRRLELLRRNLPGMHFVSDPRSFFVWLALPVQWRSDNFASAAALNGVTVAASSNFSLGVVMNVPAVRLSLLGSATDAGFVEGVRRLRAALDSGVVSLGAIV
ncbi:MAG: PLP-dependent aminotransferase family protein [Rhodospirillales bacterium]